MPTPEDFGELSRKAWNCAILKEADCKPLRDQLQEATSFSGRRDKSGKIGGAPPRYGLGGGKDGAFHLGARIN